MRCWPLFMRPEIAGAFPLASKHPNCAAPVWCCNRGPRFHFCSAEMNSAPPRFSLSGKRLCAQKRVLPAPQPATAGRGPRFHFCSAEVNSASPRFSLSGKRLCAQKRVLPAPQPATAGRGPRFHFCSAEVNSASPRFSLPGKRLCAQKRVLPAAVPEGKTVIRPA